jgi:hypothetical protein
MTTITEQTLPEGVSVEGYTGCAIKDFVHVPPRFPDRTVQFYHPAYATPTAMLELLASDGNGTGLLHRIALIACGIVACNRWDGYLSVHREPGNPIRDSYNALLPPTKYFYHIGDPSEHHHSRSAGLGDGGAGSAAVAAAKYPICPRFLDWSFPHANMPPTWPVERDSTRDGPVALANQSPTVKTRDDGCIVTSDALYAQGAHVIPKKERRWFDRELMEQYNGMDNRRLSVNALANLVTLRPDVHLSFDALDWAFVPKFGHFVAHFVRPADTLGPFHHNRKVRLSAQVAPQFLLARFALTVLGQVGAFVEKNKKLALVVQVFDSMDVFATARNVTTDNTFTFPKLETPATPDVSGTPSSSPRKRIKKGGDAVIVDHEIGDDDSDGLCGALLHTSWIPSMPLPEAVSPTSEDMPVDTTDNDAQSDKARGHLSEQLGFPLSKPGLSTRGYFDACKVDCELHGELAGGLCGPDLVGLSGGTRKRRRASLNSV